MGLTDATLYLVRHGRTPGNGVHYVGRQDLELDAVGQAQADRLGQALAQRPLDAIYTSPLARARQTAQAVIRWGTGAQRRRMQLLQSPELMEIDYGKLQGLAKADHSLRLRRDYTTQRMPGGESLADVYARVARVCSELTPCLLRGEALAVVAHYRSLQMLRGAIVGETFDATLARRDYKPGNGSVLRMHFATAAGVAAPTLVATSYCASPLPTEAASATFDVSSGED